MCNQKLTLFKPSLDQFGSALGCTGVESALWALYLGLAGLPASTDPSLRQFITLKREFLRWDSLTVSVCQSECCLQFGFQSGSIAAEVFGLLIPAPGCTGEAGQCSSRCIWAAANMSSVNPCYLGAIQPLLVCMPNRISSSLQFEGGRKETIACLFTGT